MQVRLHVAHLFPVRRTLDILEQGVQRLRCAPLASPLSDEPPVLCPPAVTVEKTAVSGVCFQYEPLVGPSPVCTNDIDGAEGRIWSSTSHMTAAELEKIDSSSIPAP